LDARSALTAFKGLFMDQQLIWPNLDRPALPTCAASDAKSALLRAQVCAPSSYDTASSPSWLIR